VLTSLIISVCSVMDTISVRIVTIKFLVMMMLNRTNILKYNILETS
jgi:hypothetical protein